MILPWLLHGYLMVQITWFPRLGGRPKTVILAMPSPFLDGFCGGTSCRKLGLTMELPAAPEAKAAWQAGVEQLQAQLVLEPCHGMVNAMI